MIIHIFGASGSGTSTLGRYICEKAGFFFMDTDDYFWEQTHIPYTVKRPVEERIKLMTADIEKHKDVVISGSLGGWGDVLIPYFDLAIRLHTDPKLRIERLRKREKEHFGNRIDVGGDMYENHLEFIEWAKTYDNGDLTMRSKAQHDQWQKLLACPLLLLDGSASLEENFTMVKEYLK